MIDLLRLYMFEDDVMYLVESKMMMMDDRLFAWSFDRMLRLVVLNQRNHLMLNLEHVLELFVLEQLMYCLIKSDVDLYKVFLASYNDLHHMIDSNQL